MAESAITNDSAHNSVLHKYSGSCSQNDYNNVKPFTENISPINKSVAECDRSSYSYDEVLPNNNVSGDEGLMDCLMDGGCVSNTSITSKVSSASASASISSISSCSQTNSETQCDSFQDPHSRLEAEQLDFKLKKQLIVKLETPIFEHKLTPEHYNKSSIEATSDYNICNKYAVSPEKTVSFSDTANINNGVIKKKRKNKEEIGLVSKSNVGHKQRVGAGRGRPPKRPLIATTYHSQISGDKNTIKIRIKKAHLASQVTSPVKKSRQRKKQKKIEVSDTDASDYDESSKRVKIEPSIIISTDIEDRAESPGVQSVWGDNLPHNILFRVFQYLCNEQGALPLLVNLCRVCKLWRQVALTTSLWENVDLSSVVKDRAKTDVRLHWLIHNRLKDCQDLNLSDWKIKNIPTILEELCINCPELRGLNLSGWSGLTAENLKHLTAECSKLERLDLSSVNGSNLGTKSALNAAPLVCLAQNMGSRLTHLVLAHNKLAGFSQILTAISTYCPNLQLLDLSNIKTHAYNSSLLHVEKLQEGCPKLRVLRVTNSQILLAPTSLTAQMASPGFPDLEELSLAGIEDDQTTSKFIDDNGIERILKSSHKLRLLDVRGCTKITDSGLVKVPAWDLEHLFLSACYVTRLNHSGLELIVQKWSHSLVEVDLAWSTATESLDAAVMTLAEKGIESPLRILNLCGSSVSLDSVKAVLLKCPLIQSINLQSCRALPRGIKRLYEGAAVDELRLSFESKPKTEDLDSIGSEELPTDVEEKIISAENVD